MWTFLAVTFTCLEKKRKIKKMPPVDPTLRGSKIHISIALRIVWSVYSSIAHTHPLSLSVAQRSCHPPLSVPVSWQLSVLSSAPSSFSAPLEFQSCVLSLSLFSTITSIPSLHLVFPCQKPSSAKATALSVTDTSARFNFVDVRWVG